MYRCCQRPEGRDPLEMELQVVVRHLAWMLGSKLGFPGGPLDAFNHRTISPGPGSEFISELEGTARAGLDKYESPDSGKQSGLANKA